MEYKQEIRLSVLYITWRSIPIIDYTSLVKMSFPNTNQDQLHHRVLKPSYLYLHGTSIAQISFILAQKAVTGAHTVHTDIEKDFSKQLLGSSL